MLLAIDTATTFLSLALHDGAALAAECTLQAGRQHSALLAPLIERTMAQIGLSMADLRALAVSVGPGSYTGTRIGVALAKGIAAPRDLPLVPITTLETILAAQSLSDDDMPLIATVSAGRNRVIWAEYRAAGPAWLERRPPQISDMPQLLAECPRQIRLCGDLSAGDLEIIGRAREAGARIEVAQPADQMRRAGYLAEVAWHHLRAKSAGAFPADRVMPIYLSSP